MIRFIIFILVVFIVYNLVKVLLRVIAGSGRNYERMRPKEKKSKYDDVEEAKFKEINDDSENKDKS